MADETLKQLQDRIDALERLVAGMRGRGGDDPLNPFPRVFIARSATSDDTGDSGDPASGTWVEQAVNDGQVADFPDGRKSLSDGAPSNLLSDTGDSFFVWETIDKDASGDLVHRYIAIRGSSEVQVHITGNYTGGGIYIGKIVTGTAAPATGWKDSNLALPLDGQSEPVDEDCIIINEAEDGESTHVLTDLNGNAVGKPFHTGSVVGTDPDTKLPIVKIRSFSLYSCAT